MKIDLSSKPHVVATVTQPDDLALVKTQSSPDCDVLEYRLDDLAGQVDEVISLLEESRFPSLATVRRPDEGGANRLGDEERLEIYTRVIPHADLVDVEVESLRLSNFQKLTESAKVVGSFHNFETFPGETVIRNTVEDAYDLGAEIAKVAVVLETIDDLFALTKIVEQQRGKGRLISAMGMGPLGRLSRLVLAKAGSCLNYGYLRVANAPGQWSAKELSDLLTKLTQ